MSAYTDIHTNMTDNKRRISKKLYINIDSDIDSESDSDSDFDDEDNDMMIISNQQIEASNKIIDEFVNNGCHWCLLLAQMQSGKTTTYYLVAAEMLRLYPNLVSNVIIFSGNNERELKDQVMIKSRNDFLKSYENRLRRIERITERNITQIMAKLKTNIRVLWGDDALKFKQNQRTSETLYIWDESHYAQSKNMRPHKFLESLNISADGVSNNSYMLSVSATPFSEFSDNYHKMQHKSIVKLQTTHQYHSVEHMLYNNLIRGFDTDRWSTNLKSIMARHKRNAPKYGLVRLRESKQITFEAVRSMIIKNGWNCSVFDSSNKSTMKQIDELNNAPDNHTIVLLKGKCRMGKVVPKQHIAFCMETSKEPNTDVILQGLLGRMCGYHNYTNVEIYISNKILNSGELHSYVAYIRDELIMPQCATNLLKLKKLDMSNEMFIPRTNMKEVFCTSSDSEHVAVNVY